MNKKLIKQESKPLIALLPELVDADVVDLSPEIALVDSLLNQALLANDHRNAQILLEVSNLLSRYENKLVADPMVPKAKLIEVFSTFIGLVEEGLELELELELSDFKTETLAELEAFCTNQA